MDQVEHYVAWLSLLLVLAVFVMQWHREKRRRIVFPQLSPNDIRFQEVKASGCSHKTLFTRLGGASRCLQVTVTDTEVWIRLQSPFNIMASQTDLEHRISRASILSVEPSESGRTVLLHYRDPQGHTHLLSLIVRKPDEFLRILGFQSLSP